MRAKELLEKLPKSLPINSEQLTIVKNTIQELRSNSGKPPLSDSEIYSIYTKIAEILLIKELRLVESHWISSLESRKKFYQDKLTHIPPITRNYLSSALASSEYHVENYLFSPLASAASRTNLLKEITSKDSNEISKDSKESPKDSKGSANTNHSEIKEDINAILVNAIEHEDPDQLEAALKGGADPNLQIEGMFLSGSLASQCGTTTPFRAVFMKYPKPNLRLGEILLRYGAKPDFRVFLAEAIIEQDIEKLDYLLKLGADPNLNLLKEITPLKLACTLSCEDPKLNPDIISLLYAHGARADFKPLPETIESEPNQAMQDYFYRSYAFYGKNGGYCKKTSLYYIQDVAKGTPLYLCTTNFDNRPDLDVYDCLVNLLKAGANPFRVITLASSDGDGHKHWTFFEWLQKSIKDKTIDALLNRCFPETMSTYVKDYLQDIVCHGDVDSKNPQKPFVYGFKKILEAFDNFLKENPITMSDYHSKLKDSPLSEILDIYIKQDVLETDIIDMYIKNILSFLELSGYAEGEHSDNLLKWLSATLDKLNIPGLQNHYLRDNLLAIQGRIFYKSGKLDQARKDWFAIHNPANIPQKNCVWIGEGLCVGADNFPEGSKNQFQLMQTGLQFLKQAGSEVDVEALKRYVIVDEAELRKNLGFDGLMVKSAQEQKEEQKHQGASLSLDSKDSKDSETADTAKELKYWHQRIDRRIETEKVKIERLETAARKQLDFDMTKLQRHIDARQKGHESPDDDFQQIQVFYDKLFALYKGLGQKDNSQEFVAELRNMLDIIDKFKPQSTTASLSFEPQVSSAFFQRCENPLSEVRAAIEELINVYGTGKTKQTSQVPTASMPSVYSEAARSKTGITLKAEATRTGGSKEHKKEIGLASS